MSLSQGEAAKCGALASKPGAGKPGVSHPGGRARAAGDTLLLCSDGLWGFVAEQEIEMAAADPNATVGNAAHMLLELALAAGGQDNIGIEMARLVLPPAPAPPASKRFRPGFMGILALCLLALAGLGALAHFGIRHHWLHALRHLR